MFSTPTRQPGPSSTEFPRTAAKHARALLFVLFGAAAYLYLNLFALPHTPFLLGGDQVFFWLDAQRMLAGQRIYQDFLQFTPPGADLFYFVLFKLFGFRIWVTNAAVLLLGVASCWMCFSLARDIARRRAAVLATAIFLVLVYGRALNATHHWFSVLAVMAAVKVSSRGINPRSLCISGALLALAVFFNQTHGTAGVVAFAIFLLWRRSRTAPHSTQPQPGLFLEITSLAAGFGATLLILNAHYIATLGLKQLWYFQVTYVTKYVVNLSQGSRLGLSKLLTLHTLSSLAPYLAVYLLLPITYAIALWRCWREHQTASWDRVALLAITGSLLLAEVALSLNWLRLFAVALPGIVLLGPELDRIVAPRRYAITLIWTAVLLFAVRQTIGARRIQSLQVSLPGGNAAITPPAYEKLHEMTLHTKPGDLLFQAGWPGMYLPLQLRNPLYLDIAYAARPEEATRVIHQLQTTPVPLILWSEHLDEPCNSNRPCDDGVALLRDYLHRSYVRVHTFPDGDTLWQSTAAHP
jgi:hypothetical protein